jgi:hypothetical protein
MPRDYKHNCPCAGHPFECFGHPDKCPCARQTIWYQVATLNNPSAEPYIVLRIDTSVKSGATGVEGEVVSLHWDRADAEARVAALSRS